ncbi:MAG TPA: methylated-DNA--[protein]-cysteine S-methyltransferase [Luteibacter sp.]|jgi:methylated-DNA-[protein]-cysteine S-methyltransferase|nr:methylated-DNA--[protein]-cysteine S-methyltransferase [Luteibacter sp.]
MIDEPMLETTIDSPVGPLRVLADAHGLRAIEFDPKVSNRKVRRVASAAETMSKEDEQAARALLALVETQLGEYFAGARQDFDLPLRPLGTGFQTSVWLALADIPYGQTRSYGEQARLIGHPEAVRAVGAANGSNPLPIVLPCHRVIGANGSLTGFGGGLPMKRFLLDLERRTVDPGLFP